MNLPLSLERLMPSAVPPSPADPLLLLRQQTRVTHEAVEALPAMRRLFAPDYTLDEYRQLLLSLWPFVHALEADLLPAGQRDRIQTSISRSEALRRDLLALGEPLATLPPMAFRHGIPVVSESHRAGVLYVLEGSALGGQLIRRALLARFGPDAVTFCRYFDCHEGAAGRHWRQYGRSLRRHGSLDAAAMVAAAQQTFERFSERLSLLPVPGSIPAPVISVGHGGRCPFARARQLSGFDSIRAFLSRRWRA